MGGPQLFLGLGKGWSSPHQSQSSDVEGPKPTPGSAISDVYCVCFRWLTFLVNSPRSNVGRRSTSDLQGRKSTVESRPKVEFDTRPPSSVECPARQDTRPPTTAQCPTYIMWTLPFEGGVHLIYCGSGWPPPSPTSVGPGGVLLRGNSGQGQPRSLGLNWPQPRFTNFSHGWTLQWHQCITF